MNFKIFIQDLTVDVVAFMSIKRLRMQIDNFTAYSNMDDFKVSFNGNFQSPLLMILFLVKFNRISWREMGWSSN